MTVHYCTRCRKPYGETVEGVTNAATSYAPFCSKRCADVDLVHWLKGDYVIDGSGGLVVGDEDIDAGVARPLPAEDKGA